MHRVDLLWAWRQTRAARSRLLHVHLFDNLLLASRLATHIRQPLDGANLRDDSRAYVKSCRQIQPKDARN